MQPVDGKMVREGAWSVRRSALGAVMAVALLGFAGCNEVASPAGDPRCEGADCEDPADTGGGASDATDPPAPRDDAGPDDAGPPGPIDRDAGPSPGPDTGPPPPPVDVGPPPGPDAGPPPPADANEPPDVGPPPVDAGPPGTCGERPYPENCFEVGCPEGLSCLAGGDGRCIPSECFCDEDSGDWVCTRDCGGGLCVGGGLCPPPPETCRRCPAGYENVFDDAYGCPICACEPIRECERDADCGRGAVCEGAGVCAMWCEDGDPACCEASICVPASGGLACEEPNPAGCADTGCDPGYVCEPSPLTVCIPSSCECDEATGTWACSRDCGGGGTCVVDPDAGRVCEEPNPAGCSQTGCPRGQVCEPTDGCAPSECFCDREFGGWTCTDDCNGGGVCVDLLPPTCSSERDCPPDHTCNRGLCYPVTPACRSSLDCERGQQCVAGVCVVADCPAIYDPVCGVDGQTWGNACLARAAGVAIAHRGACEGSEATRCETWDHCPLFTDCIEGECSPIMCPGIYDPVCDTEGRTWANACSARAARVDIAYAGECETDTRRCRSNRGCADDERCDLEIGLCVDRCVLACFRPDPVCGTDGRTYECGAPEAECNGVRVMHRGPCRPMP